MKAHHLGALLFIGILLVPLPIWGQMTLGQYQDEAPVRTWNILGLSTAASMGMGGTHFSSASDCSASLKNPALLNSLPSWTLTVNGSLTRAAFFKYAIMNTGVLSTSENIHLRLYSADFAGASFKYKRWAFSLSTSLLQAYNRPSIESSYTYKGQPYYTLNFKQEGTLKNIHFSISRKLHPHFSVGVGFNFVYGSMDKHLQEEWNRLNITITDRKSHHFQGFYINGGLVWNLSSKLTLGAVIRTPYAQKSNSESLLRYHSPSGNTEIQTKATGENTYHQPLVLGGGLTYIFSDRLKAAAEISYFKWSGYKIDYFGEELSRYFKDVAKINTGMEYFQPFSILQKSLWIPLRMGFVYDPQPMKDPSSYYIYLTLGTGVHWGKLSVDIGAMIGKERGSGDQLSAQKVALSLSYKH